jgi:hypothetical protein
LNPEKSRSSTDVPPRYLRYVLLPAALKHNQLIGLGGVESCFAYRFTAQEKPRMIACGSPS